MNLEPTLRPADLVSIEGDIPDAMEILTLGLDSLPARWYETGDKSLYRFGTSGYVARAAALLVSSAPIGGEWNVLLNPAHAEFSRECRDPEPFAFDARMFR